MRSVKKKLVTFANNILECKKTPVGPIPSFFRRSRLTAPLSMINMLVVLGIAMERELQVESTLPPLRSLPLVHSENRQQMSFSFPKKPIEGNFFKHMLAIFYCIPVGKDCIEKRKDIPSHISPIRRIKLCMKPKYTELGLYL